MVADGDPAVCGPLSVEGGVDSDEDVSVSPLRLFTVATVVDSVDSAVSGLFDDASVAVVFVCGVVGVGFELFPPAIVVSPPDDISVTFDACSVVVVVAAME